MIAHAAGLLLGKGVLLGVTMGHGALTANQTSNYLPREKATDGRPRLMWAVWVHYTSRGGVVCSANLRPALWAERPPPPPPPPLRACTKTLSPAWEQSCVFSGAQQAAAHRQREARTMRAHA